MLNKILKIFISNVVSILFGAVITTSLIYFTSHPVTPLEVRSELLDISLSEINKRYCSGTLISVT